MTDPDRIVAVGLLTERDLRAVGASLKRVYPVNDDQAFSDLLARIDRAEMMSAARRHEDS